MTEEQFFSELEAKKEEADNFIDWLQGVNGDLLEVLDEVLEYFDQRADADMEEGRYRPNEEMRLQIMIKTAIEKAERRR